ncbi:hypothetical protein BBP40_006061 [Aspergillus hancockii]|nr:hypothetical protein BBP40_006061 [Aspergillus hancockii]
MTRITHPFLAVCFSLALMGSALPTRGAEPQNVDNSISPEVKSGLAYESLKVSQTIVTQDGTVVNETQSATEVSRVMNTQFNDDDDEEKPKSIIDLPPFPPKPSQTGTGVKALKESYKDQALQKAQTSEEPVEDKASANPKEEESKEKSQGEPKEGSKDEPKEESKDEPKEESKDEPKEESKEEPKEESKEEPKEEPKEESKEEPKEGSKDEPKEESKEEPKEESKEEPKEESVEELQAEAQEEPKEEAKEVKATPTKSQAKPTSSSSSATPATSSHIVKDNPLADVPILGGLLSGGGTKALGGLL